MDKTNYAVLSIVAMVAVTAVVAMFLSARASDGVTPLTQAVSVTANAIVDVPRSGSVLTGNVVASRPKQAPAPAGNRYDLNDNGALDANDADILGLVIDRVQFCPRTKICDINGDGSVTMDDLYVLNSQLLAQQIAAVSPPSATSDNTFAIATTGGVI